MKRAMVCGAGGFIGGHLVKGLKEEGFWVRGVDLKKHEFRPTAADESLLLGLITLRVEFNGRCFLMIFIISSYQR